MNDAFLSCAIQASHYPNDWTWKGLQTPPALYFTRPLLSTDEAETLRKQAVDDCYFIAWESNGGDDFMEACAWYKALLAAGRDKKKVKEAAQKIGLIAKWWRDAAQLATELEADYWVNIEKSACYAA